MKAEQLISTIDRLKNDTDNIRAVIICRNDSADMVSSESCSEMVVGQVSRLMFELMFEMQFTAIIKNNEEPEWLSDKIKSDLDGYESGGKVH